MYALTNRVLEYPSGHLYTPAAPQGVTQEHTHRAGIFRAFETPPSSCSSNSSESSKSKTFTRSSAATWQATQARLSLDSPLPTLQHITVLQFNTVLQNSQGPITVPASIMHLQQTAARARQCESSLDKTACKQEAQSAADEKAYKQVAGSKKAVMEPQDATPALSQDLQHRQYRYIDLQPGDKPTALVIPKCRQSTTAVLGEEQPDALLDTVNHVSSLSNPGLAVPELNAHSRMDASYAAGAMVPRQAQAGSVAVPHLVPNHQPEDENAHQQYVSACQVSRPAKDTSSSLPDQSSSPDTWLTVTELNSSGSVVGSNPSLPQRHNSQTINRPIAAVTDVLDSSAGRAQLSADSP